MSFYQRHSALLRSPPLPPCDLVGVSALPARATSISLSPSAPEGSEPPITCFPPDISI